MNEIKEKILLLGKEDAREERREWTKLEKVGHEGELIQNPKRKGQKVN